MNKIKLISALILTAYSFAYSGDFDISGSRMGQETQRTYIDWPQEGRETLVAAYAQDSELLTDHLKDKEPQVIDKSLLKLFTLRYKVLEGDDIIDDDIAWLKHFVDNVNWGPDLRRYAAMALYISLNEDKYAKLQIELVPSDIVIYLHNEKDEALLSLLCSNLAARLESEQIPPNKIGSYFGYTRFYKEHKALLPQLYRLSSEDDVARWTLFFSQRSLYYSGNHKGPSLLSVWVSEDLNYFKSDRFDRSLFKVESPLRNERAYENIVTAIAE